jgi:hypothetical protein
MKSGHIYISALAGIVCGLICTYPMELSAAPSLLIWAIGGILVGLFIGRGSVVLQGIQYGVWLSFVFLFSRFGGTRNKIPKYLLFVCVMSIVGAIGGIVAVFIGSKLKNRNRQKGINIAS